jgi:hypothetical protein
MVGLVRHRQTKGLETDRPNLNHRATSRLYFTTTRRKQTLSASGRGAPSRELRLSALAVRAERGDLLLAPCPLLPAQYLASWKV